MLISDYLSLILKITGPCSDFPALIAYFSWLTTISTWKVLNMIVQPILSAILHRLLF